MIAEHLTTIALRCTSAPAVTRHPERSKGTAMDVNGPPVATIADLCARGYADRLLLSHDPAVYFGRNSDWDSLARRPAPEADFTFLHTSAVPALEDAGFDAAAVGSMLVDNTARLLAGG